MSKWRKLGDQSDEAEQLLEDLREKDDQRLPMFPRIRWSDDWSWMQPEHGMMLFRERLGRTLLVIYEDDGDCVGGDMVGRRQIVRWAVTR